MADFRIYRKEIARLWRQYRGKTHVAAFVFNNRVRSGIYPQEYADFYKADQKEKFKKMTKKRKARQALQKKAQAKIDKKLERLRRIWRD